MTVASAVVLGNSSVNVVLSNTTTGSVPLLPALLSITPVTAAFFKYPSSSGLSDPGFSKLKSPCDDSQSGSRLSKHALLRWKTVMAFPSNPIWQPCAASHGLVLGEAGNPSTSLGCPKPLATR